MNTSVSFRHKLFEMFVKIFVKSLLLSNISNKNFAIISIHIFQLTEFIFCVSIYPLSPNQILFSVFFKIHKDDPLFALFIQNVCHFHNTDIDTWCRRCKGDKFVYLFYNGNV